MEIRIVGDRRTGKTTAALTMGIFAALNKEKAIVVVAGKNTQHVSILTTKLLNTLGVPYVRDRESIIFQNGSKIIYKAAQSNSLRGIKYECAIIDNIDMLTSDELLSLEAVLYYVPRKIYTSSI